MSLLSCYIKACQIMGGNPGGPGISTIILPLLSFNDAAKGANSPLQPIPAESQLALAEAPAANTMKLGSGTGLG